MTEKIPSSSKNVGFWAAIVGFLIIGGLAAGFYFLMREGVETTAQVRDVFIIVLALESFLIGIALIILVIQLAIFTNLVQNEVKPIITSTKETVGNLKGASKFISKRAVAPIISVTSLAAGVRKFFDIVGFLNKSKDNNQ